MKIEAYCFFLAVSIVRCFFVYFCFSFCYRIIVLFEHYTRAACLDTSGNHFAVERPGFNLDTAAVLLTPSVI